MVKLIRSVCIVQARLGSERFNRKVVKIILNKPLILLLLERLTLCKHLDDLVVAIPKKDKKLYNLLKYKFNVFKGKEHDVLSRYYYAALKYNADIIIRITGDCPLVDPEMVDKYIEKFKNSKFDYISNINPPTFPNGFDIEVFSFKVLKKVFKKATIKEDREHVTRYIVKNKIFKKYNFKNSKDLSFLRLTVDYKEDFLLITKIFVFFKKKKFLFKDIIQFYKSNKSLFLQNLKYLRNEKLIKLDSK